MKQKTPDPEHFYKTLTISHYKGFYDKQSVEFATPKDKTGSGLTIIVGPNNAGKTALLEALNPTLFDETHFHNPRCDTYCKQIIRIDLKEFINGALSDQIGKNVFEPMFIPARRSWSDEVPASNLQQRIRVNGNMSHLNYQNEMIHGNKTREIRGTAEISYVSGLLNSINNEKNKTAKKTEINDLVRQVFPEFGN